MAGVQPSSKTATHWGLWPLAVALVLGVAYTLAELGELAHYHDSNAYFELARVLRVDAHRGIAYPAFLASIDWATGRTGSGSLLRMMANEHPPGACSAPGEILAVQLSQLALCATALAYWVQTRVATNPRAAGLATSATILLVALLVFDPLVSHFALSVMPDALAMAASLVFCGALARVGLGSSSPGRNGAWLLLSFTAACLLRPEKKYVLVCTALASMAVWAWIAQRRLHSFGRLPVRLGFIAAMIVLGLAATLTIESAVHRDYGRPGQGSIMLHARVIFPHLGDIVEALPPDVRERFSENDVAFYDKHVLNPGPVMQRVTRGDPVDADRLTEVMARTAVRERGPAIAFDILKDSAENVLPTLGLYPRMVALEALGMPGYRSFSRSDMLPWTHKLMTEHHSALSHASLTVSGIAFGLLGAAGILRLRRIEAGPGWADRTPLLVPWIPSLLFVLANAAAFAIHADAVSPRYTIASHVMLLALVYSSALTTVRSRRS